MSKVHILVHYIQYEGSDNIGVFNDIKDAVTAVKTYNEEHGFPFKKDHSKDNQWSNHCGSEGLIIETWEVK